jgi:hypothetical protein
MTSRTGFQGTISKPIEAAVELWAIGIWRVDAGMTIRLPKADTLRPMAGPVALTKTSPGRPFLPKIRTFTQQVLAASNLARSSINSEVASLDDELSLSILLSIT